MIGKRGAEIVPLVVIAKEEAHCIGGAPVPTGIERGGQPPNFLG